MYENLPYNERGEKILCEESGKNSHMRMDVRIQRLEAGQQVMLLDQEKETAVLLLAGKVVFAFGGRRPPGAVCSWISHTACTAAGGWR